MAVVVELTGLEDGNMAEQEDRVHVFRISIVIVGNCAPDRFRRVIAGHVVPGDQPPIAHQVQFQPRQLVREPHGGIGGDDQNQPPPVFDKGPSTPE